MPSNFNNIQKGDTVLVPCKIGASLGARIYMCRATVTATTKAQFSVESRRFKKDNGREIGGHNRFYTAAPLGSHKDQTDEAEKHRTRIKHWRALIRLSQEPLENFSDEDLATIWGIWQGFVEEKEANK